MTRRCKVAFDLMLSEQLKELRGRMGFGSGSAKLEDIVKIKGDIGSIVTEPDAQGFGTVLG